MASYLRLVLRNTLRSRRRTALTVASVAVSLCILGFLLALYGALFHGAETTPGQARRLVVHHSVALTQELPIAYEERLKQVPGVHAVTSLRWFGGAYKDARDPRNRFGQFAIEPDSLFDVHPEFAIPDAEKRDFISQKTACVASRALAERLGWKTGERITLVGTMLPAILDLTLAGIFEDPSGNAVLYFNRAYLRDSLPARDRHRDMVQQYYVEADSKDVLSAVAGAIDGGFANSPYPTKTQPEQAFLLSFVSFLGNLKLFLAAICGAVGFTMILVSGNMLSMSVRERTREVGILKTLGFSAGEVLGLVVCESTLIALAGGVLGCLLADGLCFGIATAMKNAPGFVSVVKGLSFTPATAALTMATALLTGLTSALVPGLNAARISILAALDFSG